MMKVTDEKYYKMSKEINCANKNHSIHSRMIGMRPKIEDNYTCVFSNKIERQGNVSLIHVKPCETNRLVRKRHKLYL